VVNGEAWYRELNDGVGTGGAAAGAGGGIAGVLDSLVNTAKGLLQMKTASGGQASVGTAAPRTFTFERDGTAYMVSVSDLKETLGSVMDRAQKSDVMLRDATKVSYVKKRRGVETDVVQELSDFKQLQAAIFLDDQLFPFLDFDLT
jgi:hypothetical protein